VLKFKIKFWRLKVNVSKCLDVGMDKNQQGIVRKFFYLLRKHPVRQICGIILKIFDLDLDLDLIVKVLRPSVKELIQLKTS
jgi:hypothetical protein